ncbi:hypothetical protein GF362_02755 [Candidatus Dojkabacteria bacterium]|nr:hypothetical protein [Candidatus Dojkabacteria bacterium]
MKKTRVININKQRLKGNPSYLRRRRKHSSAPTQRNKRKKGSVLQRFNNTLNNLTNIQFILLLLLIVSFSFLGFNMVSSSSHETFFNNILNPITEDKDCEEDLLNPLCWPNQVVPKLKQSNGYTNALLVGIDTREDEAGLMNTDTIMVASFNHTDGKTMLISFPRDLYLPYYVDGKNSGYFSKVNSLYAIGESKKNIDGLTFLKENIEEWLDMDIHYTGLVNFKTLVDIVDAVGGITIEVEENYEDIYPYKELSEEYQNNCIRAKDYPKYCVFKFSKGINKLDGEDALIYARMRQYSSDFDRARRQQQVIDAIKRKFLSGDENAIQKAKFAWNTYQALLDETNVISNLEYNDMIAGLLKVGSVDLDPISVVLDPTFGGQGAFMYETRVGQVQDEETGELVGGMYVIQLRDTTFSQINQELEKVRKFPELYEDNASVVIANKTGTTLSSSNDAKILKEIDPYFDFLAYVEDTKESSSQEYKIFVFNKEKIDTVNYLKDYFSTENVEYIDEYSTESQTSYKEDIKVAVYASQSTDLNNGN